MCAISGQSSRISTLLIYEAQFLASPTSLPYPVAFIARTYFFTVSLPLCRRGNSLPRFVYKVLSFAKSSGTLASLHNMERQQLTSVKTAESHRMRLIQKLDIHETASLVRYAVRRGLVQP